MKRDHAIGPPRGGVTVTGGAGSGRRELGNAAATAGSTVDSKSA